MEYSIPFALLALILTFSIGLYLRWLRKNARYWEVRGIPYEKSQNVISACLSLFKKSMHEVLLEQYKKHGRIYGSFEFRVPVLTVCEPDLLRNILVKDFQSFSSRRDFEFGDEMAQKMVVFLNGEDWKRVRTIITPAFTSRKMRQMSHIINECVQTVIENFNKYVNEGKPADVKGIFGAFTVDVIAKAAFATKIDSHGNPENLFVKNAKENFEEPTPIRMLGLLSFFILPLWLSKLLNIKFFHSSDFLKNIVLQVVKERRESGKRFNDILQLFLDAQDELENEALKITANSDAQGDDVDQYGSITTNGIAPPRLKYKKLSENELVAQCLLFFIVGYETTASSLSFMAYALALNPVCQEKLIAEVDEVFKKHEELNYDVIRDMKYLDCVVSETLRMYPSLTRADRTATENYKLGNTGLVIEKGTIVGFNIHAMHHDPEFFPNPENFYPERFLSENANHPQYAYLPFGAGPRNCLGMRFALMEIKLCMCNVLKHFRFRKAETTKVPLEYKKGQGFLSVNELPLNLEKRNK